MGINTTTVAQNGFGKSGHEPRVLAQHDCSICILVMALHLDFNHGPETGGYVERFVGS